MEYIRLDNLAAALRIAIHSLEAQERMSHGENFKSCQRAGFEQVLEEIKRGEHIEVRE